MIARPSFFSTTTALAFMVTSMPPTSPPKTNSAAAASQTSGASATISRPKAAATANSLSTHCEPCLAIKWPAQAMALTAPAPNRRISRPSVNSLMPSRMRNTGICGAQLPTRKPLMQKMAAAAQRPRMAEAIRLLASIFWSRGSRARVRGRRLAQEITRDDGKMHAVLRRSVAQPGSAEHDEQVLGVDLVAGLDQHLGDRAVALGVQRRFHLHRLDRQAARRRP